LLVASTLLLCWSTTIGPKLSDQSCSQTNKQTNRQTDTNNVKTLLLSFGGGNKVSSMFEAQLPRCKLAASMQKMNFAYFVKKIQKINGKIEVH